MRYSKLGISHSTIHPLIGNLHSDLRFISDSDQIHPLIAEANFQSDFMFFLKSDFSFGSIFRSVSFFNRFQHSGSQSVESHCPSCQSTFQPQVSNETTADYYTHRYWPVIVCTVTVEANQWNLIVQANQSGVRSRLSCTLRVVNSPVRMMRISTRHSGS